MKILFKYLMFFFRKTKIFLITNFYQSDYCIQHSKFNKLSSEQTKNINMKNIAKSYFIKLCIHK